MKKFNFRLQKLLDIRKAREREIQNNLAELVNLQNIERIKQKEFEQRIAGGREILGRKMREMTVDYKEVMMFERFFDISGKAINLAQQKIDGMEPGIQVVRSRLAEASKERKVVEKLKDRRWGEFLYELNREETKENDDMNQKLYMRNLA